MDLIDQIAACQICAERFAATATAHQPRPVPWFRPEARVLVVGQAPGMQVQMVGRPFADRSGQRLREWMGVDETRFYDRSLIAIVPMAFCFPGYDARGADLPPPAVCAQTWHQRVMAVLRPHVTLLVGGYAQRFYLKTRNVTQTVQGWQDYAPAIFPLPHPSWRNTAWLRRNPWFEAQLLPQLQSRLHEVMNDSDHRP